MTTTTVLAGPERRRRWTTTEKLQLVEESLAAGVSVAEFARQRDIHPNLIHAWRHQARTGALPGKREAKTRFAALGMSFGERLVNRRHDLFIPQNLIGVGHPFFAKVAHLFGDQTLTEAELGAPHLNHGVSSGVLIRIHPDGANPG
jgi:transposase